MTLLNGESSKFRQNYMLDRRTLLRASGGAAAVSALGAVPQIANASLKRPLAYAIFDSRLADSAAFAHAFARSDVATLDVANGLTQIWRDRLQPLWRERGGPIVGLTSVAVYSGLSEQARGEGIRSALIGRHLVGDNTTAISHKFSVPRDSMNAVAAIGGQVGSWPLMLADFVEHFPSNADHRMQEWGNIERTPLASFSLVSWMIG